MVLEAMRSTGIVDKILEIVKHEWKLLQSMIMAQPGAT